MSTVPPEVLAALREGVGVLSAADAITPSNDAMRELLVAAGGAAGPAADLRSLGLDANALADLAAGAEAAVQFAGRHWSLRVVGDGGARWLLAHDTTAADRAAAARLELVRVRTLATGVGSVVHDLNNLLGACLGLTTQVRSHLRDPVELQILQELSDGTQQGAQLVRTIARLLLHGSGERAVVAASHLADEALAVAAKAAAQRGVRVTVHKVEPSPIVRTVVGEAVQALWHGLLALLERGPRLVEIAVDGVAVPAAVRTRRCGRVSVRALGLQPGARDGLLGAVALAPGTLAAIAQRPLDAGLVASLFAQRRLGGDLVAHADGDGLRLEFTWPAVGGA